VIRPIRDAAALSTPPARTGHRTRAGQTPFPADGGGARVA